MCNSWILDASEPEQGNGHTENRSAHCLKRAAKPKLSDFHEYCPFVQVPPFLPFPSQCWWSGAGMKFHSEKKNSVHRKQQWLMISELYNAFTWSRRLDCHAESAIKFQKLRNFTHEMKLNLEVKCDFQPGLSLFCPLDHCIYIVLHNHQW